MAKKTTSISLEPEIIDRINAAAAQLGISRNAWIQFRLAEAVRAQAHVGTLLDTMGHSIGELLERTGVKDDGSD